MKDAYIDKGWIVMKDIKGHIYYMQMGPWLGFSKHPQDACIFVYKNEAKDKLETELRNYYGRYDVSDISKDFKIVRAKKKLTLEFSVD